MNTEQATIDSSNLIIDPEGEVKYVSKQGLTCCVSLI